MKHEKFNYLKPLIYDNLFDEKKQEVSNNYEDILQKLTSIRNSYFNFQAGIFNFIKDCEKLRNKIKFDFSSSDLNTIKFDYILLLNNLISHSAISLRKRSEDHRVLINFEVPETKYNKSIKDFANLEPTRIILHDRNDIDTLITSIPSISLYLNKNYKLEIKINFPNTTSYSCITNEKIYGKTFKKQTTETVIYSLTPPLTQLKIIDEIEYSDSDKSEVFINTNYNSNSNSNYNSNSKSNSKSNSNSNSKSNSNSNSKSNSNSNSKSNSISRSRTSDNVSCSDESIDDVVSFNNKDGKSNNCIKTIVNNDIITRLKNIKYGFKDNTYAIDFIDDIINYENNNLQYEHQLRETINVIDGIITYIENTYRIIIQKIKTDELILQNDLNIIK